MNYQNLVSVLASADNTDLGFDNSLYHAQPHPIIVYYYYYYGNLKTRECITLCSCRIAVQFGTAAMRHTSRSFVEAQQPRLCRECLGLTGDVNELKSRKINIK